jgi:hypothetical protein
MWGLFWWQFVPIYLPWEYSLSVDALDGVEIEPGEYIDIEHTLISSPLPVGYNFGFGESPPEAVVGFKFEGEILQ